MLFAKLVGVFVAVGTWFVSLFPKGSMPVSAVEGAFHYMSFLGVVVPVETLVTIVGLMVGITVAVWTVQGIVWVWKLIKW